MVSKNTSTIFLLLMLSSRAIANYDAHNEDNYVYSCPYERSCSSEVLRKIDNVEDIKCCQECSCLDNCHVRRLCCPDYAASFVNVPNENQSDAGEKGLDLLDIKNGNSIDLYPCVTLNILLNVRRGLDLVDTVNEPFRIIDDCLSENLSQTYPECKLPKSLENFRVVSDERGLIYKNKECAKCHGVTNVTIWTTQPVCNSKILLQDLRSYEDLYDFVLHHCQLDTYVPIDIYVSDLAKCFSIVTPSVKLCNVSKYDIELRNFYHTPFTALLGVGNEEEEKGEEPCRGDEIYDIYTSTCRPFYCPITKMPSKGACMDMFTWYEGLRLEVLFNVLNWNDSVVVDNFTHLTIDIQNEVLIGCTLCSYYFDNPGNNENIFLRIRFSTTAWYNLDSVLDYFREIQDSILEISTGTITFKLKILFFPGDAYERFTLIHHEEKGCSGEILITEKLSQNCRRIQVPLTGFSTDVREQLAPDIKVDHGIADICVEKYNEIMKSHVMKDGQASICNDCHLYLLYLIGWALHYSVRY